MMAYFLLGRKRVIYVCVYIYIYIYISKSLLVEHLQLQSSITFPSVAYVGKHIQDFA